MTTELVESTVVWVSVTIVNTMGLFGPASLELRELDVQDSPKIFNNKALFLGRRHLDRGITFYFIVNHHMMLIVLLLLLGVMRVLAVRFGRM